MTEHAIGPAIRRARDRRGMTLRTLATALGVSAGTMSAIENDKVAITVDRLHTIADLLGVSTGALLSADQVSTVSGPAPTATDWRTFDELSLDPVLTAAIEVFTETGYHGATMRMVAGAAGISVAGIYHHHRSKQHVLVALFDAMMSEVEWRTAAASDESSDPVTSFASIVEALALCHAERRDLAFIAATEMRSLSQPDRGRIAALRRSVQERLDRAGLRCVTAGEFTTTTPHSTGRAVATMCMALPYWFSPDGPQTAAEVAREYAELALCMMRPAVQPS